MERQWKLLEADPKKGLQYLLRFQGDNEPTMLTEKLRKAENLERAGWTIVDEIRALMTDDPLLSFPPW